MARDIKVDSAIEVEVDRKGCRHIAAGALVLVGNPIQKIDQFHLRVKALQQECAVARDEQFVPAVSIDIDTLASLAKARTRFTVTLDRFEDQFARAAFIAIEAGRSIFWAQG